MPKQQQIKLPKIIRYSQIKESCITIYNLACNLAHISSLYYIILIYNNPWAFLTSRILQLLLMIHKEFFLYLSSSLLAVWKHKMGLEKGILVSFWIDKTPNNHSTSSSPTTRQEIVACRNRCVKFHIWRNPIPAATLRKVPPSSISVKRNVTFRTQLVNLQ